MLGNPDLAPAKPYPETQASIVLWQSSFPNMSGYSASTSLKTLYVQLFATTPVWLFLCPYDHPLKLRRKEEELYHHLNNNDLATGTGLFSNFASSQGHNFHTLRTMTGTSALMPQRHSRYFYNPRPLLRELPEYMYIAFVLLCFSLALLDILSFLSMYLLFSVNYL